MQLLLRKIFLYVLPAVFCTTSCKRELSCEGCIEKNKPPIANAGKDTTITLSVDSLLLDDSLSFEPDGEITSWSWTKIVGPGSIGIINRNNDSLICKMLTAGVYYLELTVMDNQGLTDNDTVRVIVDSLTINHAPIACAGTDQTITLRQDTAILDGSCSTDPDGTIIAYSWIVISGSSTIITHANDVQTNVTGLIEGTYLFELTVTDNNGLSAKDTVQISVVPPMVSTECGSNRPFLTAQLVPFATLSKPRIQMAVATVGTKILFAGGHWTLDCPDCWGSSRVDVYDTVTRRWTIAELSQGRFGIAAVTVGNKVFFAGGESGDGTSNDKLYATVDI